MTIKSKTSALISTPLKSSIAVRLPKAGPDRSYRVHIGRGMIASCPKFTKSSAGQAKHGVIVFDRNLARWSSVLKKSLQHSGWRVDTLAVTAGEALKSFRSFEKLSGELLKRNTRRDSTVFALGGGTVGDAVGFLAASYLRGIDWVSVPSTLLAQVDSGLGGKTGINHPIGKNLIGAFHQPRAVICDIDLLESLPQRDRVSGLGEVIKYAIAFDPAMYRALVKDFSPFLALKQPQVQKYLSRSIQWKAKLVGQDEWDRSGVREALNFGHTFAHALEAATRYKTYRHGEAVIWGLRFAVALSYATGRLKAADLRALRPLFAEIRVPPLPKHLGIEQYKSIMAFDKKVKNGKLHFVLLDKIGKTSRAAIHGEQDLSNAFELMQLWTSGQGGLGE